jgi:hypothetical protein
MITFEEVWQKACPIVSAVSPAESRCLFLVAMSLEKGKVFVEIGSHMGRSSVVLGMVAKENGCDLTCIDPFISPDTLGGNSKPVFLKNMESIGGKYTLMDMKSDDVAKIYNKKIDLLFVDGNHLYDDPEWGGVKNDCTFWIPKVRKGGYVLFHDYIGDTWGGVKKAVDETDLQTIYFVDTMIIKQKTRE